MRTYQRKWINPISKGIIEESYNKLILKKKWSINATIKEHDTPYKIFHRYVTKLRNKINGNQSVLRLELFFDRFRYKKEINRFLSTTEKKALINFIYIRKKIADIYFILK